MNSNEEKNNEEENNLKNNEQSNNNNDVDKNLNDDKPNKTISENDYMNESTNLKTNINIIKEKNEKGITEDSILYFSNKLKSHNKIYKIFLYISIILYLSDLFLWYSNKKILHSFFNIFSLSIILIAHLHQAISFKHNFEPISREIYLLTNKIINIFFCVFIIYIINIIYIFASEILEMVEVRFIRENKSTQHIMIIIYCFINIFVPSILLIKLISIKKGIKDLSSAKGEIYETDKIGDIEVIQSVINEI